MFNLFLSSVPCLLTNNVPQRRNHLNGSRGQEVRPLPWLDINLWYSKNPDPEDLKDLKYLQGNDVLRRKRNSHKTNSSVSKKIFSKSKRETLLSMKSRRAIMLIRGEQRQSELKRQKKDLKGKRQSELLSFNGRRQSIKLLRSKRFPRSYKTSRKRKSFFSDSRKYRYFKLRNNRAVKLFPSEHRSRSNLVSSNSLR